MHRKFVATTATALAALALVGLSVAPANAAKSQCDAGKACIWDQQNYGTGENGFYQTSANIDGVPTQLNDKATSLYNHRSVSVTFYEDTYRSGRHIAFDQGGATGQLGNYGGFPLGSLETWSDRITSWGA